MSDPDEVGGAVPDPDRLSPLRLPGLLVRAFKLVWQGARGELTACIVVQVLAGVGLTLQLLLGRNVLATVVSDQRHHLADVLPDLLGLAVVTALLGFATALIRERQQILAELVERHVQGQIIDVVSALDLEVFESPAFHDRLRRAKVNAADRSWQAAFGVVTLLSGLAGLAGLAVVLFSVEPLVLPVVLVAGFPLWVATARNGRAAYQFAYGMTAADRERGYLQEALTGRVEAKEIRLFSLAAFLRRRYDALYARRITELRRVARRRMRRSLIANGGATAVTLLGVGVLVQLALTRRISPADAGVAAVAVQQLGTRLRGLDASAGNLHECSLFLDDLVTFLALRTAVAAERPAGPAPSSFQRLSVDEVSFTYPGTGRPVLQDVSIEIGAEEVVALVGRNGSGKTTLAKILCGLYAPTSGRVLWDDVDVAGCDPDQLRRGVTAIFQDFVHYELSARDNVGLGDCQRADDLDGIRAAARLADADGFLSGLPAVLVAGFPLWVATTRNGRAAYDFAYGMTAADRERAYLQEALTGSAEAKEIRLFSLATFLRRRYDDLYGRRIAELRLVAGRRMRRSLAANGVATVVTLLGVGVLVQLALTKRISPADASVAAVAVQQLGARLRGLDASAGNLHECSLFLDDLVTFLELRTAAEAERPRAPAPPSFRRLSVDGVSFTYPGTSQPVLRDVTIEIGDEEVVAIVGRNGSGKTTLAKIMCGLYAPTSGRVLWDDLDVAACDPEQLRRGVTAIFQDFVHYELSAQDNVGLGDCTRADDLEGVRQAARQAGADDFLSALPSGYDTRLS
ncbi:MAG: ATP-binding cassette domain-containing protein, partial [Acidimicrobiales bacterium]